MPQRMLTVLESLTCGLFVGQITFPYTPHSHIAGVAQSVEQLIRNQ